MIKLEHGDCLKLMKLITDKSVDMILADLPYGITYAKWDSVIPLKPLWREYKRIITDHGCIALFGSEPFSANLIMSNLKMYRYNWIWHKTQPTMFLQSHYRPMSLYENISIFYKHVPTYNPQFTSGKSYYERKHGKLHMETGRDKAFFGDNLHNPVSKKYGNRRFPVNVIRFSNSHSNRKNHYHPTQKPTDLLRYLIKTYTNKHDLVLDNVMGSGSTGVAAKELHRNFIGMELNNHYFNVAKKRINLVSKPKELVKE